jgi:hypothetical protein
VLKSGFRIYANATKSIGTELALYTPTGQIVLTARTFRLEAETIPPSPPPA